MRKCRYYNGTYYDSIRMGMIREEWEALCVRGEGICTLLLLHLIDVFTNKITELQNELTNIIGTNQLAGAEPHITLADYNELNVHLYKEKLGEFVVMQENTDPVTFLLLEFSY